MSRNSQPGVPFVGPILCVKGTLKILNNDWCLQKKQNIIQLKINKKTSIATFGLVRFLKLDN